MEDNISKRTHFGPFQPNFAPYWPHFSLSGVPRAPHGPFLCCTYGFRANRQIWLGVLIDSLGLTREFYVLIDI